ncbi:MAG: hypothetical protein ACYTDT_01140 [Planctomycetota bacterium]|jgi:hypothetical protein
MKRRTHVQIVILLIVLISVASWLLIANQLGESALPKSNPVADESQAANCTQEVSLPSAYAPYPNEIVIMPPPVEQADDPRPDEPKEDETIEVELVPDAQAPQWISEVAESSDAQEVLALDEEGERLESTVVFTRKNFPDRWYGLELTLQGDPPEDGGEQWLRMEKMLREYKTCPWPEATGFLFGYLRCNSTETKSKKDPKTGLMIETTQPLSPNWKELGAVVTLNPKSKERIGIVSETGSFFLPLDKKHKEKLDSASGLTAFVHCSGFLVEGHVRALQSVKLKGGNRKFHNIMMVPEKKLILEVNLPSDAEEGGTIWVEQAPPADEIGWDDVIYTKTTIEPNKPVYICLPSRVGEIRIGGWGENWHAKGVVKKRFQTIRFSRIRLKVVHAFMRQHNCIVIEDVEVQEDKEGEDKGDKDIPSTRYVRFAQEGAGIVDYTDRTGNIQFMKDIASSSQSVSVSYRTGLNTTLRAASPSQGTTDGQVRVFFPFWLHRVRVNFRKDVGKATHVVLHNYTSPIPIVEKVDKRTVIVKWFPRLDGALSLVSEQGVRGKQHKRIVARKGGLFRTDDLYLKAYEKD